MESGNVDRKLIEALERFESNMIAAFRSYDVDPPAQPHVSSAAEAEWFAQLARIETRLDFLKSHRRPAAP
jgi:hypothetical protein